MCLSQKIHVLTALRLELLGEVRVSQLQGRCHLSRDGSWNRLAQKHAPLSVLREARRKAVSLPEAQGKVFGHFLLAPDEDDSPRWKPAEP